MKKLITLVLALACLVGCISMFTSCGNVFSGLELVEAPAGFFDPEEFGIACRKDSTLAQKIDNEIAKLFTNGTVQNIGKKYDVQFALPDTFTPRQSSVTNNADWDYIEGKGTLVVGVTDYAPMDYQDKNGKWIGFDADLANAVGEALGLTVEFQIIDWENKLTALSANTIDCIWNGMTINNDILTACEVSGVYMSNVQTVVVKKGAISSYADLAGKRIVCESGSAGETQATAKFNNSTVAPVDSQRAALLEVKAGTADACVIDYNMARQLVK